MNERMKNRLEKLEKFYQINGNDVYVAILEEGQFYIFNATRRKSVEPKSPNEFESWIAEIERTEPNSTIIIDDIPTD